MGLKTGESAAESLKGGTLRYQLSGDQMSTDAIKHEVLSRVSAGERCFSAGKAKFKVGRSVLHVRFCSHDKRKSARYKFNINPNSLNSNYELWICGDADHYYLVPNTLIREMYDDPSAYPDRHHGDIRVVSVDTSAHSVTYAARGKSADLSGFFCTGL